MSTAPSTPTARPPGSGGNASLIGLVLLLLLLGGEYYVLTDRDKPKAKATTSAAAAKKAAKPAAPNPPKPIKPEPGAPIDIFGAVSGSDSSGDPMEGMGNKVADIGGQAVDMQVGLAARAILIMVSIALIFVQTPAPPKIGAPRKIPRKPKDVEMPVVILCAVLAFGSVMLLLMGYCHGELLTTGYPIASALVLGCGFIAGQLRAATKHIGGRLQAEKVRRDTEYGIVLQAEGNQFVNVPNPFRGTLVLGGAGAGKTFSIGEPFLEQFVKKGMCGLIYDFKFPVLASAAQKSLIYAGELEKPLLHRVINFIDMERTEKINPLRPQDMPMPAYAMEYAKTILNNLNPGGAKGGDNFFELSAEAYLTGIIWFLKNNFPALCTVPHVVAIAVYEDFTHVLSMLKTDPRSQALVQSIITAVEQKAEKQVAGIISSLQIALARLATPEISWVLSPDEARGEGFSLDLNNPANPTILTIGNDPTLARTFSPVISCIIAVALKLMNQQNKHPSFVLIDEGATIYVPGLEVIPATARSNKVAMLYMTQDVAQMVDAYGKDKTQVLISNLNNQFFGKINSAETAKLVSDMVGKEDVEMVSVSAGKSMGGGKVGGGRNVSQSVSVQERQVVRVQDAYTLQQGEFIGQTVETPMSFFQAQIQREIEPGDFPIQPISVFEDAEGVVTPQIERELKADRQQAERRLQELARTREQVEDNLSRQFDMQRAAAKKRLLERQHIQVKQQAAEVVAGSQNPGEESAEGSPVPTEPSSTPPVANTTAAAVDLRAEVEAAKAVAEQSRQEHLTKDTSPVGTLAAASKRTNEAPSRAEPSREERLRDQQVKAQKAQLERLQKAENKPSDSPMQRMIEANHQKIYREVTELIAGIDPATRLPRFPNTLRPKNQVPTPADLGEY
ncbi:TraM recognition domain-containing protein [Hymenobacter sp. J193]|uniref:TraM recognition domain-containing protein n=1 Tax=Hymenobacter sp. J193 TaxID=2898429 RepID=UPI00215128FF|nr:TraM recognition domain-containing protein [Hymenobacter sp. J193]MCR5890338.1 TraM recognition domain-containing protein [Hymenobacter sp. J193]